VLAVHDDAPNFGVKNARYQLRQLAVAQDRSLSELANVHLIENLAGCGERLDENRFLIADGIGYDVEVFERQREIFGEGAVVSDDA
jgi:hypothetical protein